MMFDETATYSPIRRGVTFEFEDQDGLPCVGWVSLDALEVLADKRLSDDQALDAYQHHYVRIHAIVEKKITASQGCRVLVEDIYGW
jgi:hypothetical protein